MIWLLAAGLVLLVLLVGASSGLRKGSAQRAEEEQRIRRLADTARRAARLRARLAASRRRRG